MYDIVDGKFKTDDKVFLDKLLATAILLYCSGCKIEDLSGTLIVLAPYIDAIGVRKNESRNKRI